MTKGLNKKIFSLTLFAALSAPAFGVYSQIPGGSSARDIPTAFSFLRKRWTFRKTLKLT